MTFSWILGRRQNYSDDVVEDQVWPPSQEKARRRQRRQDDAIDLADVRLSIEGGLVMAFSPVGDPITPELLKDACARQPRATLRLPNGVAVDHRRLITVIDAQQAGRLAEHPNDGWVEAMLSAKGNFEPVSPECLANEDLEGQTAAAGSFILDMPGGETITLHDAYPGSSTSGQPARLMVGGQAVSIAEMLNRYGEAGSSEGSRSGSKPLLSLRGDDLSVMLGDQIEARLETTADVWDGEAKVALFLGDGRPISVNDLTTLLQDIPPCLPAKAHVQVTTYPLFDEGGPDLVLDHATIVTVSGVPEEWALTTGKRSKRGSWILDPSSLGDTAVRVSGANQGPHALHVKVMSTAGHDGKVDQQAQTIVIPPNASINDRGSELSSAASEQDNQVSSSISLIFDQAEASRAGAADALLLRGIPEGASLSKGVFDPSVNGWILKPNHLDHLAIRDLDRPISPFEIELRAFHLDQEGKSQSIIVATKLITHESSLRPLDAGEDLALS